MSSTIERELESVPLDDAVVDTATDTETPVADDTPATPKPPAKTDTDAPSDEPGKDDVVIGGVRVDRFGRMHRADGTVMSKAEQDAARPGVSSPTAPVVEAPKNEPFVPTANGQPVADLFPGALKSPKGELYFPTDQAGRVEQLVARGLRYDEFRRGTAEAKQQLDQVTRRTAAEAKALEETLLVHVSTPEALQALAQRVQEVGPAMAHKELSLAIREAALAVDREFGPGASRTRGASAEHTTPLDRDDAHDTFEGYFRDMLSRPEYHGMSAELQKNVRGMLSRLPLFGVDKDGDWSLMEEVGDEVWAMAKAMVERDRMVASARPKPNTTAPSRIPPTAASRAPVGNGTATPGKKPARQFDNPFDAIRHADLSED